MSECLFKLKKVKMTLVKPQLPGSQSRITSRQTENKMLRSKSSQRRKSRASKAKVRNPLKEISNQVREPTFHRLQAAMLRAAAKKHAVEHSASSDLCTVASCEESSSLSPVKKQQLAS